MDKNQTTKAGERTHSAIEQIEKANERLFQRHTAGPWKVGAKREDGLLNITNKCGLGVAAAYPNDARLIASAPELLALLQRIVAKSYKSPNEPDAHIHPDLITESCAAISKATEGRTQ